MKINVLLSPNNVDDLYFTGKTTVVIDVLRATSVILKALENGAKEIIPVGSIDFAMKISVNSHGGHTLLCGERNTKIIEGFDLGNSPLEYTEEKISGKSIILFTTNGSKAIVKAKYSDKVIIASFNNLSKMAEHLIKLETDIEIISSGTNGIFCLEDTICAGALVKKMTKIKSDIELTDAANASLVLNEKYGSNIKMMMQNCQHGKLLLENGFDDDIEFCSTIDNIPLIPYFIGGEIKLLVEESTPSKEA
ncbi:MAG: 2-phosphosulfolactate phosphatase [Melioribacteraceae bacterium]|nr:2-phosphosulfolactate phosphatase [Melioribacteraceae bacterium]